MTRWMLTTCFRWDRKKSTENARLTFRCARCLPPRSFRYTCGTAVSYFDGASQYPSAPPLATASVAVNNTALYPGQAIGSGI